MPIYEFKCNECGNVFEVLTVSSQQKEQPRCTSCNSENTSKQLSAGTIKSGGSAIPSLGSAPSGCGGGGRFS